jgi:O-antigen ligase
MGRIEYWVELWPIAMEKPLIGHGIGTAEMVAEQNLHVGTAPHNDYLRLMLEIGVVGMIGYVVFLIWQFGYFCTRNARIYDWTVNFPVLIMLVYIGVLGFLQNIIYNVVIFPMFMGLMAIAHKCNALSDLQKKRPI